MFQVGSTGARVCVTAGVASKSAKEDNGMKDPFPKLLVPDEMLASIRDSQLTFFTVTARLLP
jgi:hypothetical protein